MNHWWWQPFCHQHISSTESPQHPRLRYHPGNVQSYDKNIHAPHMQQVLWWLKFCRKHKKTCSGLKQQHILNVAKSLQLHFNTSTQPQVVQTEQPWNSWLSRDDKIITNNGILLSQYVTMWLPELWNTSTKNTNQSQQAHTAWKFIFNEIKNIFKSVKLIK